MVFSSTPFKSLKNREVCPLKLNVFLLHISDGTDCVKCPDFKVRYSCPDDTSLWDCRDDSPDTSQVANDGNLGEDAFTDLNPDQQDTMTELVSLLKQLLGQLTDDS